MNNQNLSNIKNSLEKVYDDDQAIREEYDKVLKVHGNQSQELRNCLKRMEEIQHKNLIIVEDIISQLGWLGPNKIGNKASQALFLVIQHSDINTMEKYHKLMKEACNKGNLNRKDFALFQDRLLLSQGKKQIYGTQFIFLEKENKYVLEGTVNTSDANKKRKELGLPSIEEDLEILNKENK